MTPEQAIPILVAVVSVAAAVYFYFRKPGRAWRLVPVKGDFTAEHHLPEVLPVPAEHEGRAEAGDFTFEEAVGWMREFIQARRRHPLAGQFQLTIRKAEFYSQLIEKSDMGRWGEVDDLGRRLSELDPLDPTAAVARGRANRQLGQIASAIQFYQQALKLRPTHSVALPEFAATCRSIGQPHRFDQALEVARKQLGETHPITIESRVQLGELVRVFAEPTDPATIAHIPREQYVRTMRQRLEEMEPDLSVALPLGRSMLEDNMPELAEMVLERLEQIFHEHGELHTLRGMIQRYHHDLTAAEASLHHAVEMNDTAAARLELARVLFDRAREADRPDGANKLEEQGRQELRLAIDRDPNYAEAIALLADREHDHGIEAMLAAVRPLAIAYPSAWAPWKIIGDIYASERQTEQALAAYEQGLARQRTDALLLPLVIFLEELDRRKDSLRVADEIRDDRTAQLHDRDPMLRWRLAQLYCEARRLEDARAILRRLIDDEEASATLRQRAREVLEQLDTAE